MSLIISILRCIFARLMAVRSGLPGLCFDSFGRSLALKQLVRERRISRRIVRAVINPVSCVRYFEFSYARNYVQMLLNRGYGTRTVLDISSPRLLPFWFAEKTNLAVKMINPDTADLEESRYMASFLESNVKIEFEENVDATALPYPENSFDMATSISVIEHIPDDGDSAMIAELARVIRPGGRIVLSFPVRPEFKDEYRTKNFYNRNQSMDKNGRYFFQRYYDEVAIVERILACSGVTEDERQYWVETPTGWFEEYEKKWISDGLKHTSRDPGLMSRHFLDNGKQHPQEGMGICCIALVVNQGTENSL